MVGEDPVPEPLPAGATCGDLVSTCTDLGYLYQNCSVSHAALSKWAKDRAK